MRLLLVLLLLTPAFMGCLGGTDDLDESAIADDPATTPPTLHAVADLIPFETLAEDGTPLRGHIYLPNGSGPFATVLELSPYWNTRTQSESLLVERDGRTTLGAWLGPFIDAGFAVALVNMRGTGESGGCLQWGSRTDATDAATVVEALADQPWSNGRVGMYGASYEGWAQFLAMTAEAPSLKAAIPISPVTDLYSVTVYNGAPTTVHAYMWPLWTGGAGAGAFGLVDTNLGGASTDPSVPDTSPDHLTCPRFTDDLDAVGPTTVNGDRTPYYQARDLRPLLADARPVPTLVVNGLTNREGSIYQIDGLWQVLDPKNTRFLLGQWAHAWPLNTEDHATFNADYAVPWFDHHLRRGPDIVPTGIVEYQDRTGGWRNASAWPPMGDPVELYLSTGTLVDDPGNVTASTQTFAPADADHGPAACPGANALYVSPPLAEDVVLAGDITANLTLSSTLPDGTVAVTLWHDEAPWACGEDPGIDEDYEIARAFGDLAHRGHLDEGRPFPLDDPEVMRMTTEPFATRIPAGERIILTVAGRHDVLLPDAHEPVLTVHTGPDVEGELVFNVVEGNLLFEGAAKEAAPIGKGVLR